MKLRPTVKIQLPKKFQPLFVPKRFKVFYGGRGGAKSRSFAEALVALAYNKKLLIVCGREIQNSLEDSAKSLIWSVIEKRNLTNFFRKTVGPITGANGSRFVFKGMRDHNIENMKSFEEIDILWIEEASAISEHTMTVVIPTIRKPNSEIWMSFNPDREDDPVYDQFITHHRENSIVVKVNYTDNNYFPDVLREEMEFCKLHFPLRYRKIWLGFPGRDDEGFVKAAWWHRWESDDEWKDGIKIITADTAYKKGEGNDYSVFQLWSFTATNLYLIDQVRGKWEMPELLPAARAFFDKWDSPADPINAIKAFVIEDRASGTSLGQLLISETTPDDTGETDRKDWKREEAMPVQLWMPPGDKATRVRDCMPAIYSGTVKIPDNNVWVEGLIDEFSDFREDDSHKYDDQVDPATMAIKIWIQDFG